jgi:hypothetical protein
MSPSHVPGRRDPEWPRVRTSISSTCQNVPIGLKYPTMGLSVSNKLHLPNLVPIWSRYLPIHLPGLAPIWSRYLPKIAYSPFRCTSDRLTTCSTKADTSVFCNDLGSEESNLVSGLCH